MPLTCTDILSQTPQGLYCPLGGFHLDPLRPVPRALVTHGHSDHARPGHGAVLATAETLEIMAIRYGAEFAGTAQAAAFGETIRLGEVDVRFVPAGHVLGSAQIVLEAGGCRVVISGDYKRAPDPTCAPFECVPCDVFITEATFGLPVFRHPDASSQVTRLLDSLRLFPERAHLVGAYPLGKTQRVMALIRAAGYQEPIYIHGALERLTEFYGSKGLELGDIRKVPPGRRDKLEGAIVMCPPSAIQEIWSRRFADPVTALASGWMRVRARGRQQGVELPLVISDHCDWSELCQTIRETGAGEVWVTHGQEDALVHWCVTQGLRAKPLHMLGYGDEEDAAAGPGQVETHAPAQPTASFPEASGQAAPPAPRPPPRKVEGSGSGSGA
jgi:putative mRNA 3-end processing factor